MACLLPPMSWWRRRALSHIYPLVHKHFSRPLRSTFSRYVSCSHSLLRTVTLTMSRLTIRHTLLLCSPPNLFATVFPSLPLTPTFTPLLELSHVTKANGARRAEQVVLVVSYAMCFCSLLLRLLVLSPRALSSARIHTQPILTTCTLHLLLYVYIYETETCATPFSLP